jgi:hypothetical protein
MVTARMLNIELHQYGDELFTWVDVNDKSKTPLPQVYVMNGKNHFWAWLHNSELPGAGKEYTAVDICVVSAC